MNKNTKYCPACKETKPIKDFGRNRSQHDGRQSHCKKCRKKYQKSDRARASIKHWQERNQDKIKKYERLPGRMAHKRARLAVSYAVRTGKLPKITDCQCIKCGDPADHYHHRNGYDRDHYLDVEPVCAGCHAEIDK